MELMRDGQRGRRESAMLCVVERGDKRAVKLLVRTETKISGSIDWGMGRAVLEHAGSKDKAVVHFPKTGRKPRRGTETKMVAAKSRTQSSHDLNGTFLGRPGGAVLANRRSSLAGQRKGGLSRSD